MSTPPRFGHAMLQEWAFEPGITYLNHGTVGATPRRVLAAQQRLRDEIERQPSRTLLREMTDFRYLNQPGIRSQSRMREAASAVAEFVGARADDLVFVDNATAGVNAVLGAIDFRPDDEIVLDDHGYGAVKLIAKHFAARTGAHVRIVELPYPHYERKKILKAYADAITPRTRLIIADHVCSGSSLVMPVPELLELAHAAGVPVLVDGAHAPGAHALELAALGADWYTGNLHKWAMAPRSCAILYAAPGRQAGLHPPVISWGYGQGFAAEFDWVGTRDFTPYLAAPTGIEFMQDMGVAAMREYQHMLAWDAAQRLARRWNVELPVTEHQVGSMVTVPLPAHAGHTPDDAHRLRLALLVEDRVEVQMHAFKERLWVRLSAQVYNESADIERLATVLAHRL